MTQNPPLPLLGLCPIGKFVFSHEQAMRYKTQLQAKLHQWDVRFVDLEGVIEDGMIRNQQAVGPAVDHFKKAGIDGLFMPHCNFGTEGAAGMIARQLKVPTLLWGPRDGAPLADGTRSRDTLCGMLATSGVLHKLNVPFTYIENCGIDDAPLEQGIDLFIRAVHVANLFRKGCRIGHIGQRIDFFWSTIINEQDLLDRFNVEVLPIDMVTFIDHALDRAAKDRPLYEKQIKELRQTAVIQNMSNDVLARVLAVRDQMFALGEEYHLDGFALQDFMSLIDKVGAYCFYADSEVADRYAFGYESDIHGTISDLILRRASLNQDAAYLVDLTTRHPTDDNAVLLWHAGAAVSLKDLQDKVRLGSHWILPTDELSGMTHFRLKQGPLTLCRFDGHNNDYQLAIGQGQTTNGPTTLNNYVWMKVDNWPKWERQLIEGPFIHHAAMSYGQYSKAIIEATKYIPGLRPIPLGNQH